jgi:hypothetical protein
MVATPGRKMLQSFVRIPYGMCILCGDFVFYQAIHSREHAICSAGMIFFQE